MRVKSGSWSVINHSSQMLLLAEKQSWFNIGLTLGLVVTLAICMADGQPYDDNDQLSMQQSRSCLST